LVPAGDGVLIGPDRHLTTTITNFVRQRYPNTTFEALYPPDMNDSPLVTVVNMSASWNPSTLTCLKTETFAFTGSRNLDQAQGSIVPPMQMGSAQNQSAHLVGITGYSTPREKGTRLSQAENVNSVKLFALDQFCLMSCTAPMAVRKRRALFIGHAA
jgi:hypothetical protein